ncbi:MAG: hypothetical protein DRH17_13150 [Deltaproteobacteria bacterium]|nr:MAG: hypothetical protein DRH17_13150 [Deltaproteobacteria bacterium]
MSFISTFPTNTVKFSYVIGVLLSVDTGKGFERAALRVFILSDYGVGSEALRRIVHVTEYGKGEEVSKKIVLTLDYAKGSEVLSRTIITLDSATGTELSKKIVVTGDYGKAVEILEIVSKIVVAQFKRVYDSATGFDTRNFTRSCIYIDNNRICYAFHGDIILPEDNNERVQALKFIASILEEIYRRLEEISGG